MTSPPDGSVVVRVVVRGLVQGVGYRAWTDRQARSRGLSGTVRNRRDGSVEAVLSGTEAEVTAMVAAMRHGPSGARVDELSEERVSDPPAPSGGFRVLPTS